MEKIVAEPGSFRDPSGRVYIGEDKVYRSIADSAYEDYLFVRNSAFFKQLQTEGLLLPFDEASSEVLRTFPKSTRAVLETEKLPFISYPYEWPFSVLKDAALLHLDIQIKAFDHGIALSDATAYNVQFSEGRLIFIDLLSFRRYRAGEFWFGHRQFCEQFINPLLLSALLGVPYNSWYRGSMEGIPSQELGRLLPWWRKMTPKILLHVVIPGMTQSGVTTKDKHSIAGVMKKQEFPGNRYRMMLEQLRSWVKDLKPRGLEKTVWGNYQQILNYRDDEIELKREFVADFVSHTRPKMLWDLGCNVGEYSFLSLSCGADLAVGFEFDLGALEAAYRAGMEQRLAFQPCYIDLTNPSPSQGWGEEERKGLTKRGPADALLALALLHHLAIGKNVPLERAIDWLMKLAPRGVLEFVPKNDSKVQEMLLLREDIFPDYTEEGFRAIISQRARIIKEQVVSSSGRLLVWYDTGF